jgi:hypothetical protein
MATVPVTVTEEVQQGTGEQQQIRQSRQEVAGVRHQQVKPERCKREASHESRGRAEEIANGAHDFFLYFEFSRLGAS